MLITQQFGAKAFGAFALLLCAFALSSLSQAQTLALEEATPVDPSHDHLVFPAAIEKVEALGIVEDCQDIPRDTLCFPSELLRLHFRPSSEFAQSHKIVSLTLDQAMTTRPDQSRIFLVLARRVSEQGDKDEEWEIVSYTIAQLRGCFSEKELDGLRLGAGLPETEGEEDSETECFGSYLLKSDPST